MWISREAFEKGMEDRIGLAARNSELNSRIAAMETTVDWMRMRVNQLEHERAQLLFNYTGVKVQVPVIHETKEVEAVKSAMVSAGTFDDVGDEAAKKLGIGWNEDGTIRYQ